MKSSGSKSSGMLRALLFFSAFATAIALIISMIVLAFDDEPAAALPPSDPSAPAQTEAEAPPAAALLSNTPLCTVTICVDGAEMAVETEAETVADLLSAEGIALGALDEVSPHGGNPVYDGMKITVIRVEVVRFESEIEIAYARGVMPEGNPVALAAIDEVFEVCPAMWRGLGEIPGSSYRIRDEFAAFDALRRFQPDVEPTQEPKGCRCGDVLRGVMPPNECPLFRKVCTPENPVGPCMVSSEGSCAAYYRYY